VFYFSNLVNSFILFITVLVFVLPYSTDILEGVDLSTDRWYRPVVRVCEVCGPNYMF